MTKPSDETKSIVFFTHAPQGTLGDPSAASKLIKSIKEKYGNDVNVTIVLISEEKNKNMVINIFKNLDINIIQMPILNLNYDKDGQNLNNILKKADGIIFFPTFHHFSKEDISLFKKYYKPSFIVTEYDINPKNREIQLVQLGDFKERCIEVYTGLADKKLGVFCTEENNTSNNRTSLSKINDPNDIGFRDFLLGSDDSSSYQDTHQLFFGYFNKLNYELEGHKVDPVMFLESCLHHVSTEKNTIDFVLPVCAKQADSGNKLKTVEELTDYFETHPELIKGHRFQFWVKDSNGKMECLKAGGSGDKLIRVINGYPFTPNTMDKIIKASDEFVMVTGDQSLSEAISNEKVFIYQTMWWKEDLGNSLISTVEMCLTAESKLYQFLAMQDKRSNVSLNEFKEFLKVNKNELKDDVKKLHNYIFINRNLYKNLPDQLINYLRNPKEYINDCLNNAKELSYENIRDLIQVFPNDTDTIFDLLLQQNKLKLDENTFFNKVMKDQASYDKKTFKSILNFFFKRGHNEIIMGMSGLNHFSIYLALGTIAGIGAALGGMFFGPLGAVAGAATFFTLTLAAIGFIEIIIKACNYLLENNPTQSETYTYQDNVERIPAEVAPLVVNTVKETTGLAPTSITTGLRFFDSTVSTDDQNVGTHESKNTLYA